MRKVAEVFIGYFVCFYLVCLDMVAYLGLARMYLLHVT